ncbi:Crp/Fnr family transcriptional regulator [Solimonas marina]|uniref:Helix-turn-helix domain-containing protein n=1 Tax=Solimonas marina TaxID=2714601 RepID=A0A969WEW9_9GAMM|nr:helix-turn-helix domain-containing protein [Solimonas marina]NKF23490.1 helix-turn-helix domain-containing protein [Solimonas marina]
MLNLHTPAAPQSQDPCSNCLRHGQCLGASVQNAVRDDEGSCVTVTQLQRGQTLYRNGDAVNAVYVVQSGALKSRRTSVQGDEEIVAFRLPGDTAGLDAIKASRHGTEAVALCTTRVCRVPLDTLRREMHESAPVADALLADLGGEIELLQDRLQNDRLPAQARIAAFLLSQLQRRRRMFGAQIDHFTLPMTRVDLGRFLGLATETVSRMFTRLQADGVIACDGNRIEIRDDAALQRRSQSELNGALPQAA